VRVLLESSNYLCGYFLKFRRNLISVFLTEANNIVNHFSNRVNYNKAIIGFFHEFKQSIVLGWFFKFQRGSRARFFVFEFFFQDLFVHDLQQNLIIAM